MFNPGLAIGETINNRLLMDIFHCACEGGIRYASKTDTVTLIINNTKNGLPNTRQGNIVNFAGRPAKAGLITGANKRLLQFLEEKKPVFLFEVNVPGKYTFLGEVEQAAPMFMEKTETGAASYPVFPLRQIPAPPGEN